MKTSKQAFAAVVAISISLAGYSQAVPRTSNAAMKANVNSHASTRAVTATNKQVPVARPEAKATTQTKATKAPKATKATKSAGTKKDNYNPVAASNANASARENANKNSALFSKDGTEEVTEGTTPSTETEATATKAKKEKKVKDAKRAKSQGAAHASDKAKENANEKSAIVNQ